MPVGAKPPIILRSPSHGAGSPSNGETLLLESANSRKFRPPKFHQITFPPQQRCALRSGIDHGPHGEAAMSVVLNDLLLFFCLTALVTGILIAAATLII